MERILYEVKKVIVGQDRFLERVLVGSTGAGAAARRGRAWSRQDADGQTLARTIRGSFKRIQFTPDLVPADLVGTRIYNHKTANYHYIGTSF